MQKAAWGSLSPRPMPFLLLLMCAISGFAQSFAPAQSVPVPAGPNAVFVGDVNHDGLPDFGVTSKNSNTLTWVINGTKPTSSSLQLHPQATLKPNIAFTPGNPFVVSPVCLGGDWVETFFGDFWVELYAGGTGGFLALYPIVGFDWAGPILGNPVIVPVGITPVSMLNGDLYGDGTFSNVTVNFDSNNVTVNWGRMGGGWWPPVSMPVGLDPRGIAGGNFYGHGRFDLAVINSCSVPGPEGCITKGGSISMLQSTATGYLLGKVVRGGALHPNVVNVGTNPSAIVSGDFNGDGKLDLAVANQDDSTVSVLLGNGDGTFQSPVLYRVNLAPSGMVVADINSDGLPDLVTSNLGSNDVTVLIGNGDGTFKAAVNFPVGNAPAAIAVADFNNDGQPDIVTANSNSASASILLNTTLPNTIIPQTGWWWDPKLSGTGFFIESIGKSGKGMFVGAFLYDGSGKPTWLVSTGPKTATGYSNVWLKVAGGQTLTGPYQAPTSQTQAGNVNIAFSDASHAVLTRPDGTQVNMQRFSFSSTPAPWAPTRNAPQTGWWWGGPSLSGTGFGIEIQGTSMFAVAYVYDSSGNPVWYLATGTLTTAKSYTGTWDVYTGGPQLTSPEGNYSATKSASGSVAMTLTFTDDTHGTLTMGNTVIPIVRFREY